MKKEEESIKIENFKIVKDVEDVEIDKIKKEKEDKELLLFHETLSETINQLSKFKSNKNGIEEKDLVLIEKIMFNNLNFDEIKEIFSKDNTEVSLNRLLDKIQSSASQTSKLLRKYEIESLNNNKQFELINKRMLEKTEKFDFSMEDIFI